MTKRILFVCLGNICRSPTAEATMRRLVSDAGLEDEMTVDSAGTGSWHLGDPPDARSTTAAARRGIELSGAARLVTEADFSDYDILVAMDRSNRDALMRLAPDDDARARCACSTIHAARRSRCPTPTTEARTGSTGYSTSSRTAVAGCWQSSSPPRRLELRVAGVASCRRIAARRARQRGECGLGQRYQRCLEGGAGVGTSGFRQVPSRCKARRLRGRGRRAAMAGGLGVRGGARGARLRG